MDPLLVYTVSVVAMAGMAVLFIVSRIRLRSPEAGPWWELAFLSGVLCATAYFIGQRTGDAGWTVSVGNATMVFTVGAAWAGCVVFNGRRASLRTASALLVIGGSAAIGMVSLLPSEYGSKYAGAVEKGIALAAFSLLALIECLRRPMRGYTGAKVMAVVFVLHLAYLAPRSFVYLMLGPSSAVFTAAFNTGITTGMNVILTVVVEAAMLGIQAQHRYRMPTRSGFRPYPEPAPRDLAERPLVGALLVVGVDLWGSLRRAYGIDLAHSLALDLARSLAVAIDETEDANSETSPTLAVWRLPEGRFAVRLTQASTAETRAGEIARRVPPEFARRAALPEGRPTVSAVLVLPGTTPVSTEGTALTAAEAEFESRQAREIEWLAVVAPGAAVGAPSASGAV
ncbi:hypothetical protein ACFJGV_06395 [Cnuibacter sp. UC19_7]|uniref:hypothetical protein n=1 Tax=Cnuibacter sp. UC19_7 TaxID=3350166 RepID=UPI003670D5FF